MQLQSPVQQQMQDSRVPAAGKDQEMQSKIEEKLISLNDEYQRL